MTALAFGQGPAWSEGAERVDLAYTLMEDNRQPGNPLALRVSQFRPAWTGPAQTPDRAANYSLASGRASACAKCLLAQIEPSTPAAAQ